MRSTRSTLYYHTDILTFGLWCLRPHSTTFGTVVQVNYTQRHDIVEIMLKLALSTNQSINYTHPPSGV